MNREFAGIVACLQEIEIAIKALEDRGDLLDPRPLISLRELIRAFWKKPSLEAARAVYGFILENRSHAGNLLNGISLFETRVIVDHMNASLCSLSDELLEVIEDAEDESGKELP